jgi:protein gp37
MWTVADKTHIEWTEATWNPLVGCTAVSPGCDHCYAARQASGRLSHTPAYAGLAVAGKFTGEVRLLEARLSQPLRWHRPRRIFVNSMSDLFHDSVPDRYIARVCAVMHQTPRHTYQVLTKRHARMRSLLNAPRFLELVQECIDEMHDDPDDQLMREAWPPRNVWLGVSVENQQWADIRIPALLDTPAAVRWISAEPLLGPVDLSAWTTWQDGSLRFSEPEADIAGLDWVVVGGESGPGARPMQPEWARSLRDQCVQADVPFLFKQWGEWVPPTHMTDATFMDWDCDNGTSAYDRDQPWRVGKKRAGRLLDGRTWDEYPPDAAVRLIDSLLQEWR